MTCYDQMPRKYKYNKEVQAKAIRVSSIFNKSYAVLVKKRTRLDFTLTKTQTRRTTNITEDNIVRLEVLR